MCSAINVRADQESKQFLNPEGILVRGFDCVKQFPAKLLDIVLLKGLCVIPLKAPQQIIGMARLSFRLKIHKQLLQLEGNAILFTYLLRVMTK